MAVRIQIRRDTSANWTSNNPVLYPGEIGIETDTKKFKIGPAVNSPTVATAWNSISGYANVVPTDLSNTLNDYILAADLGVADGPAKLDADGNLLIPEDSIIFEGSSADAHETTLTVTNPTEDRTITLPNATGTVVLQDSIDTLTNKTITSPTISGLYLSDSSIVFEGTANDHETTLQVTDPTADRTITIPDATGQVVLRDTTDTLTNKSISLTSNTVTGTIAEFNTALTDADFATLAGTETLQNKTLTSPTVSSLYLSDGSFVVEGTANDHETTVQFTDPTADRTITIPDVTGTVVTTGDTGSVTNTMLAGSIANNKLSNSSITINGFSISLGGEASYSTDNISQGTTNKYFSDELAQDAIGNAVGNGLDYDDTSGAISVDPSEFALSAVGSPTGDVSMASYKITNVGTPTSANDAANKSYVDNISAGLNFHAAVHAATTADLAATYDNSTKTLSASGAFPQIDGHTINETERVLVKSQSNAVQNGIYTLTDDGDPSGTWVLTRAADADNTPGGEVAYGDFTFVQNGTLNGGQGFIMTTTGTITLGTSNIVYTQFNTGQAVVAGNGLSESTPGTLSINTGVTVDLNTAQTLTNKTITGTFSGNITGNVTGDVSGNAGTVTNGVYTNGSYADPSWITSLAKSKVGLGDVENTALSTWAGSTNITTLGTVGTGTWNATTIGISKGGTGSTTESGARTALGLAIGTDVQAYNSTLAAVAGGTYTGDDSITTVGTISAGTWSATAIGTTKGGTGLTSYTSGDILYASATDTLAKLAKGTDGQILTLASGVPSWAAAPITLPSQTGNSGKYLTTDGTTASWGTLVVPITTGTATVTANTATTVDTTALSGFTSVEYMVSLKQGSKVRTSKVVLQTDGTSVDMTEFAITETGGSMSGVVVSATTASTDAALQVTVTDATSTNVTVKFSKVAL